MTSPPGATRTGEPIPAAKPVSGSNAPHVPRRWVKDAIRVLHGNGYAVSGAEAWNLIKRWRDWRREDAERFIASEFLTFVQARGDLIQPRMKRQFRVGEAGWRTRT